MSCFCFEHPHYSMLVMCNVCERMLIYKNGQRTQNTACLFPLFTVCVCVCVCVCQTIYMPISTEGSGMPTMRLHTGLGAGGLD